MSEPETLPPECAANQHDSSGREDQSSDEAERFIWYPIELGDLAGSKSHPEADRLGGTDAEGSSYIDRDAGNLVGEHPGSAVDAVTQAPPDNAPKPMKLPSAYPQNEASNVEVTGALAPA